jgi:threonine/homoserine/homoserine lactone efflux protein
MTELLPLAAYSFVMSVTPGPNNVLLTASGATFGYRRTLPHIVGIGVGHSMQVGLTCLGLGVLFQTYPVLHLILKVAGTLYLLYLAWRLLGASIGAAETAEPLTFWEAAAFQFVNPKAWVKAITVATVFLPTGVEPWLSSMIVAAIVLVINFPCVSLWALFGVAIRRFLTDRRKRLGFNIAMAVALLATTVVLVL